jgi:hypothetical protein
MHAIVHAADVQDRDGGAMLMASLFGAFPFLIKLYADGGYQGPEFQSAMKRILARLTVEIVKRSGQATGFIARPNAGSSNAHSPGSAAADDWPRIGNASITGRSPSSASPPSASCSENYAIPHDVLGQTLRGASRDLNQRRKIERKRLLYLVAHCHVLFFLSGNLKLWPSVAKHYRVFARMISKTSST